MATSPPSALLGGTPLAAEFGAAMRDMRLAHNADLATVATNLRIRQVYLQAIEDGRFDDLPGPTYASGFVRAYAEYLGLDVSEVMRRYREVTRGGGPQLPLVAPAPVSEGRMPTGSILLVAAVLAAGAYGAWYYLTMHDREAGEMVARLPQRIAEMVGLGQASEKPDAAQPPAAELGRMEVESAPPPIGKPAAPSAAAPKPAPQPAAVRKPEPPPEARTPPQQPAEPPARVAREEPPPAAPPKPAEPAPVPAKQPAAAPVVPARAEAAAAAPAVELVSAPGAAVEAESFTPAGAPLQPEPEPVVTVASAPAAPPPSPAAAAPAAAESRVVLRATAISWVELRDAEGKRVFSRLLKKGETYNVPPQAGITLATGNAGALDILVDGQTLGPIGPVGAVRRDVLLEPEALLRTGMAGR